MHICSLRKLGRCVIFVLFLCYSCVILVSPAQVNKQTSELVFDHLHATAFQFSPLGRTILGPEDNIRNISRQDLVDYMAGEL